MTQIIMNKRTGALLGAALLFNTACSTVPVTPVQGRDIGAGLGGAGAAVLTQNSGLDPWARAAVIAGAAAVGGAAGQAAAAKQGVCDRSVNGTFDPRTGRVQTANGTFACTGREASNLPGLQW